MKHIIKALICWLVLAPVTYGFKINTHVFLGQELINDLESCYDAHGFYCVRLNLKSQDDLTVRINPAVAESILNNKKTYLNGTFGPDAFPGIVSGQLVMHPGIMNDDGTKPTGYGTGDWLKLLLSKAKTPEQWAFVYGYLGHAAADTFAHTYVNQYAGDVYELTDGEVDVEARHMMIESFIANHTPSLKDKDQASLADASSYLRVGSDKLSVPARFIKDILVLSDDAQDQYHKVTGASHLVLVRDIIDEIDRALVEKDSTPVDWRNLAQRLLKKSASRVITWEDFYNEVSKDFAGAGAIQRLEVMTTQAVAYYYFGMLLTQEEAAQLAKAANRIKNLTDDGLGKLAKKKNELEKELIKLRAHQSREVIKLSGKTMDITDEVLSEATNFLRLKSEWESKATEAADALSKYQEQMGKKLCTEANKVCKKLPKTKIIKKWHEYECTVTEKVQVTVDDVCTKYEETTKKVCDKLGPILGSVCKTVTELTPVTYTCKTTKWVEKPVKKVCKELREEKVTEYIDDTACLAQKKSCELQIETIRQSQRLALKALKEAQKAEKKALDALDSSRERLKEKMDKLHREAIGIVDGAEKLANKVVDFELDTIESVLRMSHSLRKMFELWQDDIHVSMERYVIANGNALINSMDHSPNAPGVLEPLKDWMICYLPSVTGVPLKPWKDVACTATNTVREIDKLMTRIEDSLAKMDPKVIGTWIKLKRELREEGPFVASDLLNQSMNKLFGQDATPDIHLLHHALKDKVDEVSLNKQFAQNKSDKKLLVFDDMATRLLFDMGTNLGVPFELSSFDVAQNALQLMKLSLLDDTQLNSVSRQLGVARSYYSQDNSNILTSWLRSIDGNHQWMPVAPPYLRGVAPVGDLGFEMICDPDNFSRRFSFGGQGLWFWTDPTSRENMFNELFVGPINKGLYSEGFSSIVSRNYPYWPSYDQPFPDLQTNDGSCGASGDPVTNEDDSLPSEPLPKLVNLLTSGTKKFQSNSEVVYPVRFAVSISANEGVKIVKNSFRMQEDIIISPDGKYIQVTTQNHYTYKNEYLQGTSEYKEFVKDIVYKIDQIKGAEGSLPVKQALREYLQSLVEIDPEVPENGLVFDARQSPRGTEAGDLVTAGELVSRFSPSSNGWNLYMGRRHNPESESYFCPMMQFTVSFDAGSEEIEKDVVIKNLNIGGYLYIEFGDLSASFDQESGSLTLGKAIFDQMRRDYGDDFKINYGFNVSDQHSCARYYN
jgi:ABC-type phosphate transport system auxiliary subunit